MIGKVTDSSTLYSITMRVVQAMVQVLVQVLVQVMAMVQATEQILVREAVMVWVAAPIRVQTQ